MGEGAELSAATNYRTQNEPDGSVTKWESYDGGKSWAMVEQAYPDRSAARNDVEPHGFVPLRRFFNRGRCRVCLAHERFHPTRGWLPSRALGDKSIPRKRTF